MEQNFEIRDKSSKLGTMEMSKMQKNVNKIKNTETKL